MDILAALEATASTPTGACKVRRFLDSIPDDSPGKSDLLTALDDKAAFTLPRLSVVFKNLGHPIHKDTISAHRNQSCACYTS